MISCVKVLMVLSFKVLNQRKRLSLRKKKGKRYETCSFNHLFCRIDRNRILLQKACYGCEWFCPWRTFGRPLAYCIRFWNLLFLRRYLRRICRTVRLEVRNCFHLDRYWKCSHRIPDGLGHPGQENKNHDPASPLCYHAPVFRTAL